VRASVSAEAAGVPSVSVVAAGFIEQARAVAAAMGMPELAIAEYGDVIMIDGALERRMAGVTERVIAGLTAAGRRAESSVAPTPATHEPRAIVASGSLDEIQDTFRQLLWTDGLPIIPPTIDRIEAFLAHAGRDPDESVGILAPERRQATIWSIAANGVMAGCRPEQFPYLVAAVEAVADPAFHLENAGSTAGLEPLVIVSGPRARDVGFHHGTGVTRIGRQANASLGRFLRLYLRNGAGYRIPPGTHDMATFGINFLVALVEDEDAALEMGWPTYAMDRGFEPGADIVTVLGGLPPTHAAASGGPTAAENLDGIAFEIGDGLWAKGAHAGMAWGSLHPLLVLSPAVARIIAGDGWSKDDVRRYLGRAITIRAGDAERSAHDDGGSELDLHRFAQEGRLPASYGVSRDPDRRVPAIPWPEDIGIVVAGDPHRNRVMGYLQHGGYGGPVSRPVQPSPIRDR
jgi:hypothetical protein